MTEPEFFIKKKKAQLIDWGDDEQTPNEIQTNQKTKMDYVRDSIRAIGKKFEEKILHQEGNILKNFLKDNICGKKEKATRVSFRTRSISKKEKVYSGLIEKSGNGQKISIPDLNLNKFNRFSGFSNDRNLNLEDNDFKDLNENPEVRLSKPQIENKFRKLLSHQISYTGDFTSKKSSVVSNKKESRILDNNKIQRSSKDISNKEKKEEIPLIPELPRLEIKPKTNSNSDNGLESTEKQTMTKRKLKLVKKINDSLDENENEMHILANSFMTINPGSKFVLYFDTFMVFSVLYCFVLNPLSLAFNTQDDTIIDFAIDVLFIIDIILNFIKGYVNLEEELVMNKTLICLNYLDTWFQFDAFSSIPFNSIMKIFNLENYANIFHLLRLTRLLKIKKLYSTINIKDIDFIEKLNITSSTTRFIYFIGSFIIFSHILSCFWIFLASLSRTNWINSISYLGDDQFSVYIAAIYFNWTTIFTIGYGDILSVSTYERVYNIIVMMVGILLYSFAVTSLGTMITKRDKATQIYHSNKEILDEIRELYPKIDELVRQRKKVIVDNQKKIMNIYMLETLYQKIRKNLDYVRRLNKIDDSSLIDELPIKIRNLLLQEIHKDVLKNFTFFKYRKSNNENDAFNIKVLLSLKPLKLKKGEYLIRESEVMEEIIFVKSGRLSFEVEVEKIRKNGFFLRKNDFYGMVQVVNDQKIDFNIKVHSKTSELLIMKRSDLDQISISFPKIYNKIYQICLVNHERILKKINLKKEQINSDIEGIRNKHNIRKSNYGITLIQQQNILDSSYYRYSIKSIGDTEGTERRDFSNFIEPDNSNSKIISDNSSETLKPQVVEKEDQAEIARIQKSKTILKQKIKKSIVSYQPQINKLISNKYTLSNLSHGSSNEIPKIVEEVTPKTQNIFNLNFLIQNNNIANVEQINSNGPIFINNSKIPDEANQATVIRTNNDIMISNEEKKSISNISDFEGINRRNLNSPKKLTLNQKNPIVKRTNKKTLTMMHDSKNLLNQKRLKEGAKTKILENLKFVKNPQQYVKDNFQLILGKHINKEKSDYELICNKLDDLYRLLLNCKD